MAINFPNSPSDGQVYFDTTSGNRYVYDATAGTWMSRANGFYSTVETGQVIFDANDVTGGSNGLYFSTSANTLYANSINVATDMRVRGNLYIGTNTVTITDSAIMAQTFYVMQNGTPLAVPTGAAANASYEVANSAFAHTNTTLTHSQTVYGAVNSVFGVANAGFDLANTKVSKSGDTITGTLSIVGDLVVSGNTYQLNANTMSISDPLIYLAANNYSSDIVDIGFIANYVNTGGANVHTGLYREHTDKEYYLFQGYDREPINNHIGAMSNNMTLSVLNADLRTSNLNLGGANAITWISSGYGVANAAFAKANTALQNTSGTFAGDLSLTGNVGVGQAATAMRLDVNGLVHLNYSSGTGAGIWYDGQNSTNRFFIGCEPSGNTIRVWDASAGANRLHIDVNGHLTSLVSTRSPIYYDSDNTARYVDPAGTSVFGGQIQSYSGTTASFYVADGAGASSYNYIMGAANDTGSKLVMFVNGSSRSADGGVNTVTIRNDGGPLNLGNLSTLTTINGSAIYSPRNIYFDANSGYGINLNGTSTDMHRIYLDGFWTIFKSHANEGWKFRDNSNTDRVQIYGATGQIRIAANPSGWNAAPGLVVGYNGDGYLQTRHIWGKNASDTGNDTLYLNYASGYGVWMQGTVNINGTATASADVRAPIFYDSDDTTYYANLAGASRLSGIQSTGRSGNWDTDFQNTPADSFRYGGDLNAGTNGPTSGTGWWIQQNFRHSNSSNYWGVQVAWGWEDRAHELYTRNVTGNSFSSWIRYANSNNGGSIIVADLTASGASEISSTGCFTDTYKAYHIEFQVVPGTMSAAIYLQFYTGGAWKTANYRTYSAIWNGGGSQGYTPSTYIDINGGGRIRNNYGCAGWGDVIYPTRTDVPAYMLGISGAYDSTFDSGNKCNWGGTSTTTGAITGIRIYASSGTISGYLKVYGRK